MRNIITSPDVKHNENALYHFKKVINVDTLEKSVINIFAEARYKLYINGMLTAVGPCKTPSSVKYYDAVDITGYLNVGENVIEVDVLQLEHNTLNNGKVIMESILRDGNMMLTLWGNVADKMVEADDTWLVAKESGVEFFEGREDEKFGVYNVAVLSERVNHNYGKNLCYKNAKTVSELFVTDEEEYSGKTTLVSMPIQKRTIPMMYFKKQKFIGEKNGIYDSGYLTCGYIDFTCKGKGKIKMTVAECKTFIENDKNIKRVRDDENGVIIGNYDIIEVDGECHFKPFLMRTFRFVKLDIEGDVEICDLHYIETGYPIEISDKYDFGNDKDNKLFEISANTLKRCMHETYVDCPYYEQLQYTMDTHLQMLYTYQLTADRSLPEKAIDDFASTYMSGNLIQSRCPANVVQYIPGFALFFIFMLYEHNKRFSDKEFIKKYINIADGIAYWFESRLNGYMVNRSNVWDFIDWADEYDNGTTEKDEPLAVYSLMLATALDNLTELHGVLGDEKGRYSELANSIRKDVKNRCYDKNVDMYADGPSKTHFSQHTQLWSVLSGLENGENARKLLIDSVSLKCRASVAYNYILFRALECVGEYDRVDELLNPLRSIIDLHCTTTPEWIGEDVRSECHAWSAVVLYEFTAKVLGVQYAYGVLTIEPYIKGREYAKGFVASPCGMVWVDWRVNDNKFTIDITLPDGVENVVLNLPNGECMTISEKEYTVTVELK